MFLIKKFQSSDQLFKFLNFGASNDSPVESGTGYVDASNNFVKVSADNYASFTDIAGDGTNASLTSLGSLAIILTGSSSMATVASVTNADTLALDAHAQLATVGAPVDYRIYKKEIPNFVASNAVHISEDDAGNWVVIYKDTTKTFTV